MRRKLEIIVHDEEGGNQVFNFDYIPVKDRVNGPDLIVWNFVQRFRNWPIIGQRATLYLAFLILNKIEENNNIYKVTVDDHTIYSVIQYLMGRKDYPNFEDELSNITHEIAAFLKWLDK